MMVQCILYFFNLKIYKNIDEDYQFKQQDPGLQLGRGKWGSLRMMQMKSQILFLFKIVIFFFHQGCFYINFVF